MRAWEILEGQVVFCRAVWRVTGEGEGEVVLSTRDGFHHVFKTAWREIYIVRKLHNLQNGLYESKHALETCDVQTEWSSHVANVQICELCELRDCAYLQRQQHIEDSLMG